MNKTAAKRKGSPIIFVQIAVVLLVAGAIAAGIYVQSQSVDVPAPLPTTATPIPTSQSRLVFNLNNTSFSNAVELGGSVQLGLLDTSGITSTLNLSMPVGVPYELQDHYLVSLSSSPPGTLHVFTATYTVRDIAATLRQFSTAVTATNALGDTYSFSQPLVAPDGNSIVFVLSHQEFINNGTQVRLSWTLLRADLTSDAETTLGSGQLTGVNAPSVGLLFWSSTSNQIYLTQQQGAAQNPSASVTLYPYKADGSGGGPPITISSVFSQPSPDGSKLAYLDNDVATFDPQQPSNFNRIVILDFYSGGLRRISAATGNRIEPDIAWSPDSQNLVYIERVGAFSSGGGGTPSSSLFYHILLKRLDPGVGQPTTISEYQGSANVAADTTNSDMAWCGDRLYIQLVRFLGQGQSSTALYKVAADGQGGFRRAADGEWPYQMLGCVP